MHIHMYKCIFGFLHYMIYTCIYTYVYSIYIYIYIYMCMYIYIDLYMCIYIYIYFLGPKYGPIQGPLRPNVLRDYKRRRACKCTGKGSNRFPNEDQHVHQPRARNTSTLKADVPCGRYAAGGPR